MKEFQRMPVATRFGIFSLTATSRGLYALEFPGKRIGNEARGKSAGRFKFLSQAAAQLQKYFEGRPVSFSKLPIDYSGYTDFQKKVLRSLVQIPRGRCMTYGALAARVGVERGARAVGSVMRKNRLPIICPCHRILASGGKAGGYLQGLSWKRKLLSLEGKPI